MKCKACSTRMGPGETVCPNCGRSSGSNFGAKQAPTLKKAKSSTSNTAGKSAAPSKSTAHSSSKSTAHKKVAAPSKAERRAPAAKEIDLELEDLAADETNEATRLMQSVNSQGIKSSELRAILAEEPELLGEDLSVLTGKKRGVLFSTDVGEIDLLLVDEVGGLIVVSIPDPDSTGDPVSEVLQRIGWVRKHIAKGRDEVRGIVLLPPMSEDLTYAAAAVAGTVTFCTYEMSITFEELEL
jgi:RecB family endonuclease NucS